jgi:glyceraldehyde 3-phosphate dehydrogenase
VLWPWASENIIPSSPATGSAVCQVIPEANGKFTSMALHVPEPVVLAMDPTCLLERAAKCNDVRKVAKWAPEGPLGHPGLSLGPGCSL